MVIDLSRLPEFFNIVAYGSIYVLAACVGYTIMWAITEYGLAPVYKSRRKNRARIREIEKSITGGNQ